MDQYPELNVNEREDRSSSRHDSGNSVSKATVHQTNSQHEDTQYTSFPPPSTHSSHRSNSSNSDTSTGEKSQQIEAEYARYTDAPPPYSEKQYEGKSDDEQNNMRMTDYAKEISRQMGRQLVTGLKTEQMKESSEAK